MADFETALSFDLQKTIAIPATKLNCPPPPRNLLRRPALLHLLAQWRSYRLIVLIAPPGYGKTMLVAHWLHESRQTEMLLPAWLALDEDDDDPVRFVAGLAAALKGIDPEASATATALALGRQQPRAALLLLLEAIEAAAAPICLVLDDLHRVGDEATHQLLALALERSPANLHWMLLSRRDIPITLGRLRLQDQVLELDSQDLRLDRLELEEFLAAAGDMPLADVDLDLLFERTEGWIAGVQMALISLRRYARGRATTVHDLLEHVRGDNMLLADYLTGELLARQPEEMRRFLLQCAIAPRLHADLCDAITGQTNGARLLRQALEQRLFLQPIDPQGEWCELHQLFREMLLRYLAAELDRPAIYALYQRAASWLLRRGDMAAALHCLLTSGASDAAADLVQAHSRTALLQNRLAELRQWVSLLPAAEVAQRPSLLLDIAWLDSIVNQSVFASSATQAMGAITTAADAPRQWHDEAAALRLLLRFFGPDQSGVYSDALAAVEQFDPASRFASGWMLMLAALVGGHQQPGAPVLEYAQRAALAFAAARYAVGELYVFGFQALVYKASGDAGAVLAVYQQVRNLIEQQNTPYFTDDNYFTCLTGEVLYWQDRVAEAAPYFQRALSEAEKYRDVRHILMARTYLQLCDAARGRAATMVQTGQEEEERLWPEVVDVYALGARAEIAQRLILRWLVLGAEEQAWRTFQRLDITLESLPPDGPENAWLALLTAYVACGKELAQLGPALDQLHDRLESERSLHGVLQVLVLKARQLQQLGRHVAARTALRSALRGIEQTGYVRLILDHPKLAPLLRAVNTAYAQELLQRMTQQPPPPPPRTRLVLTAQEAAILALLAEECSNQEIAARLVLTEGTVKWYVNRLYKKLGASNRRQAVARARSEQLL